MPDRSCVKVQTKRDTLVPQVGGWDMWLTTPFLYKSFIVEKLFKTLASCLSGKRPVARNKENFVFVDGEGKLWIGKHGEVS